MAKFIIAATKPDYYPEHNGFECCLLGRSNVGKSTLINALAKNKIAYVSKTPGRTRTLNFYDYDYFYLVDLPGYGYAKMSKNHQTALADMAENYLHHRTNLMSVIQVCDINVITELDVAMKDYLTNKFDNYLLCLNKIDKLSKSQMLAKKNEIQKLMNLPDEKIMLISAAKKINTDKVFQLIKFWTKK